MPSRNELLADHFLKAAGIPAVYVDEAGAIIGTVDVVGIDTPSAWRLLCCAPGKQIGIATKAVAQAAAPSTNAKERVPCLQLRDKPPVMSAGPKSQKQAQEQTQTIATAIGKPAAKAPKIVKVNAESRFASGRTLSNDMSLTPLPG